MFTTWKLGTVGVVLATGIFSAQAPNRLATEGEWFVECSVDRLSNKRDCEVAVEVKSTNPAYHLGFIYRVGSGMFLAVGLPAPSRIVVRVDHGEAYELGMCTGQACLLRGRIAGQLRQRMHEGEVLRLEFRGADRVGGVAEVSLIGFNKMHLEALDRLAR
jgi:invasion protein IalB